MPAMSGMVRAAAWLWAAGVVSSSICGALRAQQDVIRTGITIVPIDVRAFDRQGRPVANLTPEEFRIFEDGVPQQIAHFSTRTFTRDGPLVQQTTVAAGTSSPAANIAPPPTGDAASPQPAIVPQASRVYLIVLGRGRLQLPNRGLDGVLHFLRMLALPQDRVAILAYNRATNFTTEHESLVPIVERYKKAHEDIEVKLTLYFSGLAGLYRDPSIPAFIQADIDRVFAVDGAAKARTIPLETSSDRTDADYRRRVTDALVGDPSASLSDKTQAALEGMSLDEFVASSVKEGLDLGNVQAGINYLRNVDGEKHLIYVAYGGFTTSAFAGSLESLARSASHARVALDIVHTGGMQYRFRTSEPSTIARGLGLQLDPFSTYLYGGTTIGSVQTSQMLARETGGAFNANRYRMVADDLTAMDRGARFQYTLGYYPSKTAADNRYRKLEVRTTRPGVTLQYRGGYYARPPQPPLGRRELLSYTRISRAFEYAPAIEDIKVRGTVTLTGEKDTRQVSVDLSIDTARITLAPDNGRHVGSIEVVVFTIDGRGRQIQDLWQRVELALTDDTYQKFKEGGIPYSAELPAPPDLKAVKIVVYDYTADLVGSLVLPVR
jgi:VWFA-related protein